MTADLSAVIAMGLPMYLVDNRTRAIAHWIRHGDPDRTQFWPFRSPDIDGASAIAICKNDLRQHLSVNADRMSRGADDARALKQAIDFLMACETESQLDELRAWFRLPTLEETRKDQVLPQLSYPERHRVPRLRDSLYLGLTHGSMRRGLSRYM